MAQKAMKMARQMAVLGMFGLLATATPLLAQESAARPFGLDPYKPSDAKILREIGPALVTQMPVRDLSKLDPYNPTDAALLRQMGGAIPICCLNTQWPIGPIGPIGAAGIGPSLTHVVIGPRARTTPAPDPNAVWVCKGSSCATEDVRTYTFSTPPTSVNEPAPAAPPATPGR